ncbi:MAG: hypothetical protein JWP11_3809 [Frankiales bacterium]|nr:hypothetical protein [Frankiales bacterium]
MSTWAERHYAESREHAIAYVAGFLASENPQCQKCKLPAVVQLVQPLTGYTWQACRRHAAGVLDMLVGVNLAVLRPVCEHCGDEMPVPRREQGGGRTKRYCSTRCRTAAYRLRQWPTDTLHAALGTEPANRL